MYDGPEFPDKKSIIKIIEENEVKWSHEFQKIQKKELLYTNKYSAFLDFYFLFFNSIKSFDDMYELLIVFANIILEKNLILAIYFFIFMS